MPLSARAPAVPSYKVGLPHVTDDVRRAALLAQLSDGHRRAKVVWVVGLPGAGKTSLVARWIAESNVRAMGYRLDADDADGAAWVDAVGESCSPQGEALPVWSPENQADLAEFARPFFATLARRELTLVIDDGHRVGDDSPIFAMLAELHEVAGDALRAIVVSRRAPPPVLARGSVAGWLALVDDLRLTADEAAAIACAQRYFVDAEPGRFRLHDLLRDALLRVNVAEETPASLALVRRGLADWIGGPMPEAAMQLRAAAGDTDGALALLATHGAAWLARGLHASVHGWLRDLPAVAEPGACAALDLWRARALLPLEPERARTLFATSREAAALVGDTERAASAWCGQVESYVIQWGAVQGLAELVDDLEVLEAKTGPFTEELTFRTGAAALTALMYGRAEDPRMTRFAQATARAVTHAPDAGARISAAAQLLIYKLWWAGDFPGGRALYDSFDQEVSEGEHLDPLPRLLWWSNAAIVDWQCGSPAECYRKVDRGLALAASSGVHLRDFFLLTQGIFCALNHEDRMRAEAHLQQLARTERTHKRLDVMVHHFFRSWYGLSRDDARTALAHAERAWEIADTIGSMFHKVIVLSVLGPARVATFDLEGAEAAYRAELALAKAAQNPTFSFIAFCPGAEIALARGDEAGLRKQVERILMVKELGGFHSICGWRTSLMQRLLAFALDRGVHPEIARTWIRQKRVPRPFDAPAAWPAAVSISCLGGLTVSVDARELAAESGTKSAKKLRTLVAVLAARRSGVTQAQLADWLWQDSEGDRAASSLKVAIHRVRKWLGTEAVRVHEGRVSLNDAVVDCDVWRLDKLAPIDADRVLLGFDEPPIRALRAALRARTAT